LGYTNETDCVLFAHTKFSGEERFGKYLDLHEFYTQFLNLPVFASYVYLLVLIIEYASNCIHQIYSCRMNKKPVSESSSSSRRARTKITHVDYITYVGRFSEFSKIPQHKKLGDTQYQKYCEDLLNYLFSFYRRTQPLVDLDDVVNEAQAKFEKDWALGEVKGWGNNEHSNDGAESSSTYCAPCAKQFASKAVFEGHLKGKKHIRASQLFDQVSALIILILILFICLR